LKEIIPFKKDIIFKTKIAKINDISLTHDYKILDNIIEGEFLLVGNYKMTEASVINEEFIYNIPFSIALSDRIDKDTINLTMHNFNYEIKGDVMSTKIELDMECEEKEEEKKPEEIKQEEIKLEESIDEMIESNRNFEEIIDMPEKLEIKEDEEKLVNAKEEIETKNSIMNLTSKVKDSKETVSYKVYIVRENDNVDNIAAKYNVTLNDLMDYNDINTISIGDKLIIPYTKNE
jgi:LysM repeat protein